MDLIKQTAIRMKVLREIEEISAEALAKELNIDLALYEKYESGSVDIPLGFLYEFANRFHVQLTEILTGEEPKLHVYSLVRKDKGLKIERTKAYEYLNLAYNFTNKKMESFLVTVPPSTSDDIHLNNHPGQEFNYILEGRLKIVIDKHDLILNQGDTLYFDSNYMHGMKALDGKEAKFLAIIAK
jgi:quercetin dioxygenase-like cupin family protein